MKLSRAKVWVNRAAPHHAGNQAVHPDAFPVTTALSLNVVAGPRVPHLVRVKSGDDTQVRLTERSSGTAYLVIHTADDVLAEAATGGGALTRRP